MVNLEVELHQRLESAFGDVAGQAVDPVLRRSRMADFQADGAMALGSMLERPPRDVAEEVVARVDLGGLCSHVDVAGPGFINLTIDDGALGSFATTMLTDDRLGVGLAVEPQRVAVDYSAPNVAKEMHVGHLRSTVIGDAAAQVLEWLGHEVIRRTTSVTGEHRSGC